MRSGRKEIILVVEGGDDIRLFSNLFGLARSNFVSCSGKNNLMGLFLMTPCKGLDNGTIFIRDRDFDEVSTTTQHDVSLIVSDLYDIEMILLSGRIFGRIMGEYLGPKATDQIIESSFQKIVFASAHVGALRLYSQQNSLRLDFDDLKFDFVDPRSLEIDVEKLVKKVAARSQINVGDQAQVATWIADTVANSNPLIDVVCGKDVLSVMHIALCRHYKCCDSGECNPAILSKHLRISTVIDDLMHTQLMRSLIARINCSTFPWAGPKLSVDQQALQ